MNIHVNIQDFFNILLNLARIRYVRRDFHGILPELREILDNFQKSTKFEENVQFLNENLMKICQFRPEMLVVPRTTKNVVPLTT